MDDRISNRLARIKDLAKREEYARAIGLLDEIGLEYQEEPKIWETRGFVLSRAGDGEAAIAAYSKALSMSAQEPHPFYMRGIVYFEMGSFSEAISDFTKVLELCDFYQSDYYRASAHGFRADAYIRLKDFKNALAECNHVPDGWSEWTDKLRCKADLLAECARE